MPFSILIQLETPMLLPLGPPTVHPFFILRRTNLSSQPRHPLSCNSIPRKYKFIPLFHTLGSLTDSTILSPVLRIVLHYKVPTDLLDPDTD